MAKLIPTFGGCPKEKIMEVKVTIETWNDEWHFEIEDKEDCETLNAGYYPTFGQCVSECNRHLSQLHAAEHSAHPTKATPRWFEALVNKFVVLRSRLRG